MMALFTAQTDNARIEAEEELINGTKVVFEIKVAEPGSPVDERPEAEQTSAILALLQDVSRNESASSQVHSAPRYGPTSDRRVAVETAVHWPDL
jgi:hypothetical protein